jgi:hypothetical protein
MYWFAINREGINPVNLQAKLLPKLPLQRLLEILEALQERSLIEITETGLGQQPVIMEYVTEHFLQTVEREIIEGQLNLFRTHTLLEAQATKCLRGAQIQLILYPLTERLLAHFGSKFQLEQHLGNLLDGLQGSTPIQTGYGEENLLSLFCYLKTDLKGFDFSSLAIRQAYPLNTVLHDTDYTNAQISPTILAETFGGIVSIAFSPNGQYLASISDDCRVKLWEVETGQCLHTYEGHTNNNYYLNSIIDN